MQKQLDTAVQKNIVKELFNELKESRWAQADPRTKAFLMRIAAQIRTGFATEKEIEKDLRAWESRIFPKLLLEKETDRLKRDKAIFDLDPFEMGKPVKMEKLSFDDKKNGNFEPLVCSSFNLNIIPTVRNNNY